ncbi:DUF3422 domain-containing protein [Halorhodospira halochloris]|uniref:DUF3422 family protein n=1 Tax=Halorhodospira halochloris TaxID=1052 RepID=UPI001EE87E91|nr:DUF3422 domain-containing protein [Halorhodospira halochloris]MCG5531167.1 DUF3422 domain-containing protein [Halorhodospira halochloris]
MSLIHPPPEHQVETIFGAFNDHPLRQEVNDEVHARPHEALNTPVKVSHLGMLSGRRGGELDRQAVVDLCRRYGVEPPQPGAQHLSADFGDFRLKWERRTELSTYTFFVEEDFDELFADPPLDRVPLDWLYSLPGPRLVGVHLTLEPAWAQPRSTSDIQHIFDDNPIVGSHITGGAARVWSDFRIQDDGFTRVLMRDVSLRNRQAGRAVQRILEIETYRMMALLAFPVARQLNPEINDLEEQLAWITEHMTQDENSSVSDEQGLLGRLTELAARIEGIGNNTNYRFHAAKAYNELVQRRIHELREQRVQGVQTIQEFMERRMVPAMRTCETVSERLESLSRRITRTGDLLRTRVDVALEAQNRDLLDSMNRRADMQFRLQETVEGLSVAAISYYLMGLISYVLKAGHDAGYLPRVEIYQGLLVPVVVLFIWAVIRIVRHRIARKQAK